MSANHDFEVRVVFEANEYNRRAVARGSVGEVSTATRLAEARDRLEAALVAGGEPVDTARWLANKQVDSDPALAEALSLGLAWEAAEKALPEGRMLRVEFVSNDPFDPFEEGAEQYSAAASRGQNQAWLYREGPTPTAALVALKESLEASRGKE